jgi:gamma-tubulin complex component 3
LYQRHEILFTNSFLQVSRPFFATLHKWLFSGELYDPFEEFFVSADSSLGHIPYVHPSSIPGAIMAAPNDGSLGGGLNDNDDFFGFPVKGQKLWEAKYRFRKEMLPAFVGESFGKKVLSVSDRPQ